MPVAALYARVSSDSRAEKDLSMPSQLDAMRKYARERNWDIHHEYIEKAASARSADRPAFREMITTAKQENPPFSVVLVWKLSCFARGRKASVIYKSLLERRGIQVVSVSEPVDDSPTGQLLEGIIEVMDESYSLNLAQVTRPHK